MTTPAAMHPDAEIDDNFFGMFRLNKIGHIERLAGTDVVPVGVDLATGTTSKDVLIDRASGLTARLFLPDLSRLPAQSKLPVLVYFHGGGFCIESPFSSRYTGFLNSLAAKANALAVSVAYRLAPEHPLPAAYDDSMAALRWAAKGGGEEEWLTQHGETRRLFVAGYSAGANIAHQVALRAGREGLGLKGMALIHPFFWGQEPMGSEAGWVKNTVERLLGLACPGMAGMDNPWINPLAEGVRSELAVLPCECVLVETAGEDFLSARGAAYSEALKGSGWGGEAELVEVAGEEHVFHLEKPASVEALALMDRLVAFLNRD